ncbi:MAG: metallophosphoesterase family protein [Thermodesulfobacteriota bacterium]
MKFLYTSDLHGETILYEELYSLILASSTEFIGLGGDLFPSFPPSKRYQDMIPYQQTFIEQFLLPFFKKVLETTPIKKIFLIPGNWDLGYFYLLKNKVENIIHLDQAIYQLDNGYEFIGYSIVPPTPFRPKDYEKMDEKEAPWPPQKNPSYIRSNDQIGELISVDPYLYLTQKETIQEDLSRLPNPLDPERTIYMMHSPPFETKLDLTAGKISVGSRSIKVFIEQRQPLLTLHGHIHESPKVSGTYFDRIGKTLSINPGQFSFSKLQAVTFEIENVEETLQHTCYP